MGTNHLHIVEHTGIILKSARTIRDIFPDTQPELWERLAPFIEQIEETAMAIRRIAKDK